MACASTPCMSSSTAPPCISWSSFRSKSNASAPLSAASFTSSPKATSTIPPSSARAKPRATAWIRNGATTSTTRFSRSSTPRNRAADITTTSAPWPTCTRRSNTPTSTTASIPPTASASMAALSKRSPRTTSFTSTKITTRSATAPKASASSTSPGSMQPKSLSALCSRRRTSPCCSWEKSGPRPRPSSTSPTTKTKRCGASFPKAASATSRSSSATQCQTPRTSRPSQPRSLPQPQASIREDIIERGRQPRPLIHMLRPPRHEVHQQIIPQCLRRRKVRLPTAHRGHLLHELHQRKILRQHERVDHDARAFAAAHLFERLRNHDRVKPKCILVDAPIVERQRRRLAVGNHYNLLHVLRRPLQNPLRHPQPLAGIGIVRPHLDARQLRNRNLLRRIVKQHQRQRVPGILRADQMPQRHRHALGRSEAVLAVQNHRVGAVQQHHRRA